MSTQPTVTAALGTEPPPSAAWLPRGGVLLHIGPPKTGTTALQSALASGRAELTAQGVDYPGAGRVTQHSRAAAAVLGIRQAGSPDIEDERSWTKVARRARRAEGRTVLSSELFADAGPEHIARIAADLGDRLRVLITLRPLEDLLASTWQQDLKGGRPQDYDAWLHDRLDERRPGMFWRRHAHDELVQRWADAVGVDRVRVLAVDPLQPELLLRQVEQLVGLRRDTLIAKRSNRSLTLPEAELLRTFQERLGDDYDPVLMQTWVRWGGFKSVIENRKPGPDEARITTPPWAVRRARELHAPMIEQILAGGVTVMGDPAALLPTSPVSDVLDLREPEPVLIPADAAAELALGVFRAAQREHLKLREQVAGEPVSQPAPAAPAPPPAPNARRRRATALLRRRGGGATTDPAN